MEQPAVSFDLDPVLHVQALTVQRNEALDEGARWRAVAVGERARADALQVELDSSRAVTVVDAGVEHGG